MRHFDFYMLRIIIHSTESTKNMQPKKENYRKKHRITTRRQNGTGGYTYYSRTFYSWD